MKISAPSHPAYTLLDVRELPIWDGVGYVYRHERGTRVLSICGRDPNKTFGIVFPTYPTDHTGLPHILEHSVLCGSERFPVKEPFKEMLKSSLQTFLNAFTYPDRTCYPVASQNRRDFYNLMDVYLDAVFFPRLTPAVLGQEGWRLQRNPRGELEYQGVVFNEMKGVYSSPDARMDELAQQSLFPDTLYRFDYGGHPAHIPELTFERFARFHREAYHPANALVGFYGDDDPVVRLEKLDEALSRVPAATAPSPPVPQRGWASTRRIEAGYPASEAGDEGVFCQLNWLLEGDTTDHMARQTAGLASHLLLNTPASPLRLDLLKSGLGDDLLGGSMLHLLQPAFSAGLRGVKPGNEEKVFQTVLKSLERVAEKNFRPDLIEGALNQSEFQMREMNSSAKGLHAILTAIQPWQYGGDPLDALDPEPRLEALRQAVDDNPRLFADWIGAHLLDNPNRTEVMLRPDFALADWEREREAAELRRAEEEMRRDPEREEDMKRLVAEVEAFQLNPDAPEHLAALPRLTLDDVPALAPPPAFEVEKADGVELSRSYVKSNDILYLQLAVDYRHLSIDELHLLPLYSRCLTELGAGGLDHLQFNEQVACHTGGISARFETTETYRPDRPLAVMLLKTKCLRSKTDILFDLVAAMLTAPRLGPAKRVRQLLQEERANEEADMVQSGNEVVALRLKASMSGMERASEEMDGVNYLRALRELEKLPAEELRERLVALHGKLIHRAGLRLHTGGETACLLEAKAGIDRLLAALPEGSNAPPGDWPVLDAADREGLRISSSVQYVGMATRLPEGGPASHFSHFVAQRLLNNDYLWERVRMQGGAYGSSSSFSHLNGQFVFTSFRDPHVKQTLDIYRNAGTWLAGLKLDSRELEQAVIGTLGKLDPPERPSSLVSKTFFRHLLGLRHKQRLEFWRQIRGTGPEHLRAFGALLAEQMDRHHRVSVLGGSTALSRPDVNLEIFNVMGG